MSENNNFRMGLRDGIPIFLGYFAVSFAFGIFSVSFGLSVPEAVLISMTNLTSAGQLAAVPIICGGGSFIELAASQLVINLRYSLMSVSLSQRLGKHTSRADRFWIAFGVTDEIFAVAMSKHALLGRKYFAGLILMPYLGWSGGTLLGAAAGNILPSLLTSALGIAIYGMFIAIIVPEAKKKAPTALCVLFSVALGCAFRFIPPLRAVPDGFVIIICAVTAGLVFAALFPVETEAEEAKEAGTND